MILGGDRNAAEWCLLNSVSRVYKRDPGLILGNLSCNFAGVTAAQAELLIEFLQAVVPLINPFESTIDSLSETTFGSRKNYDNNLMELGLLGSMTSGTLLVMDETKMKDGKLIKNGVYNIKAVATLIEEQTIQLDYKYY